MKSRSSAPRLASPAPRKAPRRKTLRRPTARKIVAAEPAERKKRSTHRRSAEIIEAAAQVFAQRGYHGATTQDIADVLQIRQASLYYYFPSKEVALELVCMRGAEGFYETERAIALGPGTATERLSGLIRAHISPLLDRANFVKVFLTQRQFLPVASRRKVGKVSRAIERLFEDVLQQGQRSGEFRRNLDTRLATLSILSVVNGCAAWYAREQAPIERIGGAFIAFVLHGIGGADTVPTEKSSRKKFTKKNLIDL